MIWQDLINLALTIAYFLIGLFQPADSSIVTAIENTESTLRTSIIALNFIMDVNQFFLVLSIMLVTEIALFAWHAGRWIITLVTGGLVRAK